VIDGFCDLCLNYIMQWDVLFKNELLVWGSIRYKHDSYIVPFILWEAEGVLPHIELQKGYIVPMEKTSVQRVSVAADMKKWAQATGLPRRSVPWILTVPRGPTSITNSSRDFIHVLLATVQLCWEQYRIAPSRRHQSKLNSALAVNKEMRPLKPHVINVTTCSVQGKYFWFQTFKML
jgi:hypothetical protein